MHPEDDHRFAPRQSFDQTVRLERSRFFTGEDTAVLEIGQTMDISPLRIGI